MNVGKGLGTEVGSTGELDLSAGGGKTEHVLTSGWRSLFGR